MSSKGQPKYGLRHRARPEDNARKPSKTAKVTQKETKVEKEDNVSVVCRRSQRGSLKIDNPLDEEVSGHTVRPEVPKRLTRNESQQKSAKSPKSAGVSTQGISDFKKEISSLGVRRDLRSAPKRDNPSET